MASDEGVVTDRHFLDRQSRTIGTYGLETMARLISFEVLIVGCDGVGAEVAKNLALAGVRVIRFHDPQPATAKDMGVNFAITAAAIAAGKTRAEATAAYIADLNPNIRVLVAPSLSEHVVSQHHAVVFTAAAPDLSMRALCGWSDYCRRHHHVSFLLALQVGVLGSVFVDHGEHFVVKDADGRPMLQKLVLEVTEMTDKAGVAYSRVRFETPEGQTPGALRDYTQIKFTEVRGLCKCDAPHTSINEVILNGVVCPGDPRNTVRIYPSLAAQGYGPYETGGFIHELKETQTLRFRDLRAALQAPGTFTTVSPLMDNSEETRSHLALHALLRFADAHEGRLPALHSLTDADEVVHCAQAILAENRAAAAQCADEEEPTTATPQHVVAGGVAAMVALSTTDEFPFRPPAPPAPTPLLLDTIDETALRGAAVLAQAELQPLAAFIGAVVAQEVVKITGKYTPIYQWFHLSCDAVLPHDYTGYASTDVASRRPSGAAADEYTPCNSRYDHLISIFGRRFQEKLSRLRIFMVGCGALGCENIKNFALCGIACRPHGSLVVTDNDRIEVSNLSRQFLFREENVGQSKSAAAASRMRQMNADCNVDARQDFVGPNTEHLFPDTFWRDLDVVVNALDNMEARLYVDQQCVRFHKVLVEAGTMGTGGNVDIIVPGKTTSYADGGAADQSGGIPMCTLRNFPYIYDHCIEWARAQFDDLFVAPMQTALQIIADPDIFVSRITRQVAEGASGGERRSLIEKNLTPLRALKRTLKTLIAGADMRSCVELSWELLFRLFRDRILDLQNAFPRDAVKKNGEAFWSGHRKYPTPLELDASTLATQPDAMNFLIAMANLFACMLGVHPPKPEARFNDEAHRWMAQYRSPDWLLSAVHSLRVPAYVAHNVDDLDDDLVTDAGDASMARSESTAREEQELAALLEEVRTLAGQCRATSAAPLEFEKDDDDNFQIDFIAAASNLRAANYGIPTQDRMKVKLVAGKIIPAIATTTSAVTGLALIELLKVLQGKSVSTLRNGMIDVGTNNYVLFERDPPIRNCTKIIATYLPEQDMTYRKKIIRVPDGFTKYDAFFIPVTPSTTVREFATKLAKTLNESGAAGKAYKFEIDGIGVGKGLLWNGRPSHPNTNLALLHVIEQQKIAEAGGSLSRPFWEGRLWFYDLSVTVSLDGDEEDDMVDEVDVETAPVCLVIEQL